MHDKNATDLHLGSWIMNLTSFSASLKHPFKDIIDLLERE